MDDSRRPSKWQDDAVQAAKARGKKGARGAAAQKELYMPGACLKTVVLVMTHDPVAP